MPWKDPQKRREYERKRSQDPKRKAAIAKASKESHERRMQRPTTDPVRARRIARVNAWNKAHPEKVRLFAEKARLRREYGLTLEELRSLFESQEGLCGICSKLMCLCQRDGKRGKACPTRACIDHDHSKTGRESVRGLLCDACNNGLGRFRDRPDLLRNAVTYLETSRRALKAVG